MKEKLLFFSIKHPLLYILLFAAVLKLAAAFFTDGWLVGGEFNYFSTPESWMENSWIVYGSRLILGMFSLLIITLAYRITKIIADKTTALEIAVFMSFLWFVPYLSVHPWTSTVSLPFLLYGTLLIIKQHNLLDNNEDEKFHRTTFIIAGFFLGLGFAFFYFSIVYFLGIVITLFILKNWKGALMAFIGYIIAVIATQTLIDLVIYHRPFVDITHFLKDFCYLETSGVMLLSNSIVTALYLLLFMVPPMSLMFVFGFFRVFRKYILLVLPALIAFIYTIFILNDFDILFMAMPTYVIAGYVGWKEFHKQSAFWTKNKWMFLTCYILFALLNVVMMILTFFYL